jgi:hypothetical protein
MLPTCLSFLAVSTAPFQGLSRRGEGLARAAGLVGLVGVGSEGLGWFVAESRHLKGIRLRCCCTALADFRSGRLEVSGRAACDERGSITSPSQTRVVRSVWGSNGVSR